MGKVYTLPGNLFNKRVSSVIKRFDIVRSGDVRHGRATLECGHVVDTVSVLVPTEGAKLLCRTCSGLADPKPDYTTKG